MRLCAASTAGMLIAPGSVKPSASTMAVIVLAVPIVLQVPTERVMRASIAIHSSLAILPMLYSAKYFLVWVPAPTAAPR